MRPASRLDGIELSLIRQINALATPLSVNLGIGEPNLRPDETFLAMARRAAEAPWRYSPNAGFLSLRKILAEGTPFDPATEVCVTAGVQEALFAVFQAWVERGDEVLIPNPGFLSYGTMARITGAKVVTYDLEPPSWNIDLAALERAITKKTKLIIVNSPSNPLGAVVDEPALRAIAALADEHDCLVVFDEIYREIWYEEEPPTMIGMSPNVIVTSGMSKSHGMTGLRLGWLLARADLLKPVIAAHQYIATCASVFSQALTESVFTAAEWNTGWLIRLREQFRRQRDAALHAIEHELGAAVPPPAGAFYTFVPVPTRDTEMFAKTLATDAAVLVIPGVAFGAAGEGFVRISYAASLEQIGTGIERTGRWLRAAGR
ncbi:MAG TPA: pyridoxal phosphate-dependent aminotransferase [Thermoanaerobaculia bacterium]|nr:pyridoxal phosphate-dependent aminotransferase [Thermoanaerobaculia bacterium]